MNSTPSLIMSDDSALPTPNPKIRTLDDGCVRIQVGEYVGTVSSMHLVDVKINQLMSAWKSRHQSGGINQRSEV
jgi:hypothetical protein